MPESNIWRSMPDALFIAGHYGLLRQYLGGGADDPLLSPEDIEGRMVEHVWPRDVAKLVMSNIKRVLRTRDGYAFEFELADEKSRCNYEMRLLVQGRDRVMMIIRNTSAAPADFASPRKRGSDLYRAIKSDPGVLAEAGAIRAIESLADVGEASA
jgi:hypothetical protein